MHHRILLEAWINIHKRHFSKSGNTECVIMSQTYNWNIGFKNTQAVLTFWARWHGRWTSSTWSPTPTFVNVFSKQKAGCQNTLPITVPPIMPFRSAGWHSVQAWAASTKPVEQQQQQDGGAHTLHPQLSQELIVTGMSLCLLPRLWNKPLKTQSCTLGRGLGVELRWLAVNWKVKLKREKKKSRAGGLAPVASGAILLTLK